MLSSHLKLSGWTIVALLVCCGAFPRLAQATVFRDRTAFNAASQNLHTIDFESEPNVERALAIDGITFESIGGGPAIFTGQNGNKLMIAPSVGEITRLIIFLPPGTTAVGCDQFNTPMIISISPGDSAMMNQSDPSTFVGFVSDQPIQTMTIFFDFPEPTPEVLLDNLSFGQRRVGNEPPVPQLLVTASTGRAVALDSVTKEAEPFHVLSSRNLATDGHTRITFFLVGVALEPADLALVTVQAEDSQHRLVDLPCEATAKVKNFTWMSQVTVRVPDALVGAGELNITVRVRGIVSNKAPLRIE